MTFYEKYKALGIDLECIGFDEKGDRLPYFCTPEDAVILAGVGADGIHFCTSEPYGSVIFAVSPMDGANECIHAVAKSFEDFLRLLIACRDTAAIEQAWQFDKNSFYAFLEENQPDEKALKVLDRLSDALSLEPIEEPYEYITELQKGFDYSKLRFSEEFYELTGALEEPNDDEWAVYFNSGYGAKGNDDEKGREIAVNKTFKWGNDIHVPSVYICKKGVVADFCIEVDYEKIKAFIDKYRNMEEAGETMSFLDRERLESENPMNLDFKSELVVNGKRLKCKSSYSIGHIPYLKEEFGIDSEAVKTLKYYSLNDCKAYRLCRVNYIFNGENIEDIESLELKISAVPTHFYCDKLENPQTGDKVEIVHPRSNKEYLLTVLSVKKDSLEDLPEDVWKYPNCFTELTYAIEPEVPKENFFIRDISQGDSPIAVSPPENVASDGAACIGIIGGTDGPTMVMMTAKNDKNERSAISSLHFTYPETLVWQPIFSEKTKEDMTVTLI